MTYNPSYQEMGAGGRAEIDRIELMSATKHWLNLIDAKEDSQEVPQELIDEAYHQIEVEEQKLKGRQE
jgi:hypothetical protein